MTFIGIGLTITSKVIPLVFNALEISVVEPFVMKSPSALLSSGLRCMEVDFSFLWLR